MERYMMVAAGHGGERWRVRVVGEQDYSSLVARWYDLDDRRRLGAFPDVRYFAIRAVDDPDWQGFPWRRPWTWDENTELNREHGVEPLRWGYVRRYDLGHATAASYWVTCLSCGKTFAGSGFGVGSHNRHCPGLSLLWMERLGQGGPHECAVGRASVCEETTEETCEECYDQ